MRFGPVPLGEAEGAILAHALMIGDGRRLSKGTVLGPEHLAQLAAAGIAEVVVARLEDGDAGEDDAARDIAAPMASETVRAAAADTGRGNLYATANGLFVADRAKVDAINALDPGITFATIDDMQEVVAGRMVATVKIIPYAIPRKAVEQAAALAGGAIRVEPYMARRVGVVSTMLPSLKPSVMDKTLRVLEGRLALSGSVVTGEQRVEHTRDGVAEGLARMLPGSDLAVVFGASAIGDIDDVIPSAIRALGGRIEHFGMPVDPGNLLLVGEIGGKPVIGAPGCARSPAENGFDWVLQRLLAGRKVTAAEVVKMGVGGLLMEIGVRPQPREPKPERPLRIAAVILAAGRSSRMGSANKMAVEIDGKPMLRHAIEAAVASGAAETVLVTGYEPDAVARIAAGSPARLVHNPDYADGMSTSLAAGIRALGEDVDAALVMLGDMPRISAAMVDRMIETANSAPADAIVMAAHDGRRGNPVLWPRRHFGELTRITGDVGARHLIAEHGASVVAVELGAAAGFDVDTPQVLAEAGGVLPA